MNASIGPCWEKFNEEAVQDGRYGSASEVVREGLRLMQERGAETAALREKLQRSTEAGGDVREKELDVFLEAEFEKLEKEGY